MLTGSRDEHSMITEIIQAEATVWRTLECRRFKSGVYRISLQRAAQWKVFAEMKKFNAADVGAGCYELYATWKCFTWANDWVIEAFVEAVFVRVLERFELPQRTMSVGVSFAIRDFEVFRCWKYFVCKYAPCDNRDKMMTYGGLWEIWRSLPIRFNCYDSQNDGCFCWQNQFLFS